MYVEKDAYLYIYVPIYIHMYTCIYTCMCISIYIYICMIIYVRIYFRMILVSKQPSVSWSQGCLFVKGLSEVRTSDVPNCDRLLFLGLL